MKVLLILIILLLAGCSASLEKQAYSLSSAALKLEPPENWRQKEWLFEVNHYMGDEYSYRFKARFKDNKFPYYSCLRRGREDPWLELEILEYDDGKEIQKDLSAMYYQDGAYIEILMSGNVCDIYPILMTKITHDSIQGFKTTQGWGRTSVNGTVNKEWGEK
jgi:hypothetical protein